MSIIFDKGSFRKSPHPPFFKGGQGGISGTSWLVIAAFSLLFWANLPCAAAADGWSLVTGPREWKFPRDFGAHPEYRTEWWYFTGNLAGPDASPFGYQLTFFRQGIRKELPQPANAWDLRDLYLAHFTVTDVRGKKFYPAEKVSRAGPGLAGAFLDGMNVWLLNWSARMKGEGIDLFARDGGRELRLKLVPRKPPALHGENGFSRKGPEKGQASYYVSLTSLETRGTIKMDGAPPVEVQGTSWFDQEFGSNQLLPSQKGWDWFSLHLSDGRELMLYILRLKDGGIEPASSGTLVAAEGSARHIRLPDFSVSVLDRWKSPRSKGEYPSRWRVQIPSEKIDLTISPLFADQELITAGSTGVTYWEGAVSGQGISGGQEVTCKGYVELTGYAGSLAGTF